MEIHILTEEKIREKIREELKVDSIGSIRLKYCTCKEDFSVFKKGERYPFFKVYGVSEKGVLYNPLIRDMTKKVDKILKCDWFEIDEDDARMVTDSSGEIYRWIEVINGKHALVPRIWLDKEYMEHYCSCFLNTECKCMGMQVSYLNRFPLKITEKVTKDGWGCYTYAKSKFFAYFSFIDGEVKRLNNVCYSDYYCSHFENAWNADDRMPEEMPRFRKRDSVLDGVPMWQFRRDDVQKFVQVMLADYDVDVDPAICARGGHAYFGWKINKKACTQADRELFFKVNTGAGELEYGCEEFRIISCEQIGNCWFSYKKGVVEHTGDAF